jgi:rsbT co-antagonist protein RsbR
MTTEDVPHIPWPSAAALQAGINAFPDPIFLKDLQHRWTGMNTAFCQFIGQSADTLLGRSDPDLWPAEQAAVFWAGDDAVFTSRQPSFQEERATGTDGMTRIIWTRKFPLYADDGSLVGLAGIITDVTELNQREDAVRRLEAEVIATRAMVDQQRVVLDELSVPVIEIWEHILLLPIVGGIDSRRAQRLTDDVLHAVQQQRARALLVDLTGVPVVDTAVAAHLVHTIEAALLLGCQSMLVGIRPEIAQTLVSLGIDLSRIPTLSSLQAGLQAAIGKVVTRR